MVRIQYVYSGSLAVTWLCANCGQSHIEKPSARVTGGCTGHTDDEYCYCSSATVVFDTKCTECKIHTKVTISTED